MLEFLTGLILYRYCAVNDTYCEFMCATVTPCLEGSVQITHLPPLTLAFFWLLSWCSLVPHLGQIYLYFQSIPAMWRGWMMRHIDLSSERTPRYLQKIPCELGSKVTPSSQVRPVTPYNLKEVNFPLWDILKVSMMEDGVEEGFIWKRDWIGRVSPGVDHYLSKTKCDWQKPKVYEEVYIALGFISIFLK